MCSGQVQPGPGQVPAGLLEVALGGVQRDGYLLLKPGGLALPFPDLVLSVADGFQELGIGTVPAARLPVRVAARLVARCAACRVERPDRFPQAGDGGRVDARAGRAGEDPGEGRGELAGVVQHLRARVQLFFVAGHQRLLMSLREFAVWQTPGVVAAGR